MKLFIGVCNSQDTVPSGFFWTFTGMVNPYQTTLFRSSAPWDVVRNNQIINAFLSSNCDVLAKMDIDQLYPSLYLKHFVELVEQYKVIGPLIKDRDKRSGHMPLTFASHEGLNLRKFPIANLTGIVEIPYAHTNLFYAREVLEKISPPWYEAYATPDGLSRANHVDFTFLDKIKAAGYPIYIDLGLRVAHQYTGWTS